MRDRPKEFGGSAATRGAVVLKLGLAHLAALEVGPPELFDLAAAAGYARVGLRMRQGPPGSIFYPVERQAASAVRARARAAGVEIFDVEFVALDRSLQVDALEPWMATAAELGASRVNSGASGDDMDIERNAARFGGLCDLAQRYGLGVDLEFMRWRKPIASLDDAIKILSLAARPNGRLLIDLLHVTRSGGTPRDLANVPGHLIGHIQISDAPLAAPPESEIPAEARERRWPPGEGELPLLELMNALPAGIPLSTEAVTTRSIPELGPLESARRAYEGAMRVLARWQPRSV